MRKIYQPTIQQLRLFEAVARHKSMTQAAVEVNLAQPSVSMQVRSLEEKIGTALTEQIGKSLYLTAAGEEVAQAAKDILARLTEMETALHDLHDEIAGPLRIAVVSTTKYFLPRFLGEFKHRYPKVEPRILIANREEILTRINENADDLYIMGQPPEENTVEAQPFLENVIVFAAPANHPLATQKNISLARIAEEDIIAREPGSGTRKAIERRFDDAGVALAPSMEFDDPEAIKQGVISGLGIAYLSLHALRLERAAGEIAILDVAGFPLRRRWYVMNRRGKRLSNAALRFQEDLLAGAFSEDRPL